MALLYTKSALVRILKRGYSSPFRAPLDIGQRGSLTAAAPSRVFGCKEESKLHIDRGFHVTIDKEIQDEGKVDPFSLVADELAMLGNRLRLIVSSEVLLLMASSMTATLPEITTEHVVNHVAKEQRIRQQRIAEITEMIHVASLLHDDVLDSAETRRGIGSLNFVMGNKLAVLAGDFLLSRASVALASLKNTEVVELLSKVLEHLVTGEIMQLTSNPEEQCSMEYYLEKTFFKTASLLAHSCKAIAVLSGQSREVATLAYEYGRHLGLAFQMIDDVLDFTGTTGSLGKGTLSDIKQGIVTAPLIFAMERHPMMHELIYRKFQNSGDIELAIELLNMSDGIKRARQLASEHASQAAASINSLPPCDLEKVKQCRRALIDVSQQVLTRTK
eukprot:c19560_g1_i1 orf=136-1299(+)